VGGVEWICFKLGEIFMDLIKGREIADEILENLREKISQLEAKPTLAVLLIGEDEASRIYVGLKQKAAESIGMNFELFKYGSETEEKEILAKIKELNDDEKVSGMIVQLPLPDGLDKEKIINSIKPEKDVDGFCDENQNNFCCGGECKIFPVFPKAIVKMVEAAIVKNSLKDIKSGMIICNSDDFGKIMREALYKIGIEAEYFFCKDLENNLDKIKKADVIVTACGVAGMLENSMTKDGAIVIDGGITKVDGKVRGDVEIETFENSNSFISPVPGGVGPVTVACLLENTFLAGSKK